jgi:hypothetical protein
MSMPNALSLRSVTLHHLMLGTSVVLALAASGCCFTPSSTPTPTGTSPFPPIAPPSMPVVAPAAMQMVTLAAGFAPDPNIITTTAGGSVPASSFSTGDAYCAGSVGAMPNVTLTTTTPISGLRVLVRAGEDTTLVVRLSDGRMLCDDDGGGYPNPMVQGDFPAGVHQVYVGSFHVGETPQATVAFTTNPMLTNAALP